MLINSFVLGSEAAAEHAALPLNVGDILMTVTAFLILLYLLKKYAFGPLMGVMKEREAHVADQIDSAEKSREETARLLEEQRALLKQSRQDALANIEESRKIGEKEREQIVTFARQEAEKITEKAKSEIEYQTNQAIQALREQTAQLSVAIASKVIGRELNVQDQQKMIDDLLREAGEGK
ncbi:MAG: atpF [Bacillales bacterium]|nr:atpF [Bacillales bacterium]